MPKGLPERTADPETCTHPEAELVGWGKKHGRPTRKCNLCHKVIRVADLASLRSTSKEEAEGELSLLLFSSISDYEVEWDAEKKTPLGVVTREGVNPDAIRAVRSVRLTPPRDSRGQWGIFIELHSKGDAILRTLQLHGLLQIKYSKEIEELILAVCENRPDLLRRVISGENAISVIKDALAAGGVM